MSKKTETLEEFLTRKRLEDPNYQIKKLGIEESNLVAGAFSIKKAIVNHDRKWSEGKEAWSKSKRRRKHPWYSESDNEA